MMPDLSAGIGYQVQTVRGGMRKHERRQRQKKPMLKVLYPSAPCDER